MAQNLGGVSRVTVSRYLDLLVDLLLVRRLQPWASNTKKRLIKSPKIYLRDSGLLHTLLNLRTLDDVLGHPIAGASWEGFALEAVLAASSGRAKPYFYRSATGQEIDLVLEFSASERWAIEFKKSLSPSVEKGFHIACADIKAKRRILVYPGQKAYPANGDVEVMSVVDAARTVEGRG